MAKELIDRFTVSQIAVCVIALVALLTVCSCSPRTVSQAAPNTGYAEQNTLMQPGTEDGQWTISAKDYANTRFSGLDQINPSNIGNLKVAWTFSTGIDRGQEAAPIVVGDTMYVVTPYPNQLYALDLKNNGATKWRYDPAPDSADFPQPSPLR